jgi:ribosomal protein L24E
MKPEKSKYAGKDVYPGVGLRECQNSTAQNIVNKSYF